MFCSNLWCTSSGIKYSSPSLWRSVAVSVERVLGTGWQGLGQEPAQEPPSLLQSPSMEKPQASSAFRWDFPFETQPLTFPAPVIFIGFLKRIGWLCLPGDLPWTIRLPCHCGFPWSFINNNSPNLELYKEQSILANICMYRKTFWQQNLIYIR